MALAAGLSITRYVPWEIVISPPSNTSRVWANRSPLHPNRSSAAKALWEQGFSMVFVQLILRHTVPSERISKLVPVVNVVVVTPLAVVTACDNVRLAVPWFTRRYTRPAQVLAAG